MIAPRLWAVIFSPHLDDGILSSGGRIFELVQAGWRVTLATVFTADEPVEPPSPLAKDLRRWWKLPAGKVMEQRRKEDESAARRLGCEVRHLGFPEAPYRTSPEGIPLYADLQSLYRAPAREDRMLLEEISEALREFSEADLLLAPLGVGGHVDHLLVRQAAEAVFSDLWYYEEFPYLEWKRGALSEALGSESLWEHHVLVLDPTAMTARLEAIAEYRSQVPAMFRNLARLGRQLRRSLRRTGGERLFRRKPTT